MTLQTVFLITDKPIISLKNEMLENHPLNTQIFGNLLESDYNDLKSDIKNRGIQDPLHVVKQNDKYVVVSGHQRLKVAKELDINLPCIIRDDLKEEWQVEEQLIKDNLLRRHLNDYQKVNAGERLEIIESEKAKEKQKQAGGDQRSEEARHIKEVSLVPNVAQAKKAGEVVTDPKRQPTTRDVAAKAVGMSHGQYDNAKKIKYEAPDPIKNKWAAGEITTGTAIKKMKDEQKKEDIKLKKEEYTTQTAKSITTNKPTIQNIDFKDYLNKLQDNEADLLITDPPYMTDVKNIEAFVNEWVPLALSKVKESGRCYICTGNYPVEINTYLNVLLYQDKFTVENILVWTYRNTLGPQPKMTYKNNWQAIFYLVGKDAKNLDCPIMTEQFSVQDINAPDGRQGDRYHKWQKPMLLAERFIRHSGSKGDKLIDPFCGTGTFIIAGAKHGMISSGADNDINILNVAKDRGCNVI